MLDPSELARQIKVLVSWAIRIIGLIPLGRLAVSSLLSVIGGSTVLAFLSTYATYWYALRVGIRIPVEGLGFLSVGVAIVAALLIVAVLVPVLAFFVPQYWLLRYCSVRSIVLVNAAVSIVMIGVGVQLILRSDAPCGTPADLDIVALGMLLAGLIGIELGGFVAFFRAFTTDQSMQVVSSTVSDWGWRSVLVLSALLVTIVVGAMFEYRYFGKFLYVTRNGGGIPVSVECRDGAKCPEGELQLMLTTNSVYILQQPRSRMVVEVPRSEVTELHYDSSAEWPWGCRRRG